ncbi:transglycosylase SLT domain-containing protein [Methylocapsa polymorpha]|uniref:Transglycosylase SLT domain-containing protein n=1 Tax=Methylocapsa polymorpha TaxID=3080828 RepID=A0ABZ0HWK9_9HYPH|nr:transglycosylase SLT domain-containing protein [Methylocapsa sp. RX1]
MCEGLRRVAIRLVALAILWLACATPTAVAQELNPADRSNIDPEAPAQPGSDQRDGGQQPHEQTKAEPAAQTTTSASICLLVESAAQAHGLPFEFFARLIWQESRFKPNAVGAMTRNGQRAQGIAQFMPGTASERGLSDLFNPVAALPKSAEFLEELHAQFGNLGLAAAAYNAGPRRVSDWIAGRGELPAETRNYVIAITGRSADEWAAGDRDHSDLAPVKHTSCRELMATLREQPSPFVGELERRVRESAARPWGVQLSAGFLRDRVLAAYAAIEKSYRGILENQDPIIIESKFRSRGTQTFYQARVGADTQAGANKLCAALHKAGGACLVLRNWIGKSRPL